MKIGIDWGGTKIEGIAIDPKNGTELNRIRVDSPKENYEEIVSKVVEVINELSKDSKNFRDLHPDNTENFFLNLTREETSRGLNPTTISDLTGIPRQTVIRNLKNLTKSKALEKDTRRNLFYVPKNTSQQKSIVETLKKIQLVISQNVNKTLIAV
jgi:hypothetical protein